ncbi:hypothetical protein [Gulosibacter faecalis]|jgi:hypothetical protein|uniref:Uncharacterized protein n=1 Tax=Gulosibacter faecalis TaxID=272240 RepID=A0ABW5UYS6_9MICO|nr:hypothetical protein [Gulosibacter faecalis]
MTITLLPRTNDLVRERAGLRIHQLTETRWRVTQPGGAIVGYLERRGDAVVVMRMTADRRGFFDIGEFDDLDEAFDALRRM